MYDIEDDRVHDASEMLREWKDTKRMDKDTIDPNWFNTGYDDTYKSWLKDNIRSISFPIPRNFCSIEDKDSKAVNERREVKRKAQEMYVKFIENQDAFEKANKEVEKLRRGYDEFDSLVK